MREKNILKRIIRLLPDGVFAIDLTGKVILWNKVMEEITEVTETEIIGKGLNRALPPCAKRLCLKV